MSKGPAADPLPPEGYQPISIAGLIGTVTDILNSGDVTGRPLAVGALLLENTSAATAFVQFFNTAKGNVTLGTTVPTFEVPVAATTGFVSIPIAASGLGFYNGLSCASTTTTGGLTGSAAGVRVTAFVRT